MKSMIVVACLALACGAHASGWAGPPANIALSQDGRNILDTPEVAQARAAHLAALSQANQNNPNPQDDGSYDPRWDNEEYWQGAEQNKWNAPAPQQWNAPAHNQWNAAPAAPAWNAAGHAPAPVAETPEVAQARAAHLAALNAAKAAPAPQQWNAPAHNQWNAAPAHQQWNAPSQWNGAPSWQAPQAQHQPANIRLANDGSGILDTPEVAAARAAHLAAHAQVAHAAPAHAPQQHW
ncbi:pupal cuticle protein-like [Trichoplusia ni]|uniref:Pupal cuticle protein-like n=1 Tax=Trichoplusia ni TaxID=7111 RepID=A0A7E5WIS1_TRINI|nr:pupal cuticle protein-like [Trichoplusia ni]